MFKTYVFEMSDIFLFSKLSFLFELDSLRHLQKQIIDLSYRKKMEFGEQIWCMRWRQEIDASRSSCCRGEKVCFTPAAARALAVLCVKNTD